MNQTSTPPNPALGFGMQGMGADIARIVVDVCKRFQVVTYLEIGVGYGITLAAISNLLRSETVEWRAIGVDLPNGYSLDTREVADQMIRVGLPFEHGMEGRTPTWDCVTLYLANSHQFIPHYWFCKTQLVLIDGCHGKACAMDDFINVESFVEPGGIVMFHDFGEDQVGQPQPHCPAIDVRGATKELGLFDNTREGWHFNETIIGNKVEGSGDMGVFQKL